MSRPAACLVAVAQWQSASLVNSEALGSIPAGHHLQ
jgi:hypothetical protein